MKLTTKLSLNQARLFQLTLCIVLSLIISMTGIGIPGLALMTTRIAEAAIGNQTSPQLLSKNTVNAQENALVSIGSGSPIASGNSFLSDLSIFRANLQSLFDFSRTYQQTIFDTSFIPTLAPSINLVPTLSLIGNINFFVEVKEIDLIKVNYGEYTPTYASLDFYEQGVKAKDNYNEAIKYFNLALSKNGSFAEAYVGLGNAYSNLGDAQIVNEYQQHDLGNSQKANEFRQQAKEYQIRAIENYTKAMQVETKLKQLNEDRDRYVEPLLGRAAVYIKVEQYQEALNDFNTAIERNPNLFNSYIGRAAIYTKQGNFDNAIADLTELIKYRNPNHPVAFFRLGSIEGELGEYEKAVVDLTKAIDSQDKDASIYYADAYYKRGIANLNLGDYQKSIDDFNQAIKRDSNYIEAYYNRGVAFAALGKYAEATNNCNQALQLNPNFAEVSNPSCVARLNLNHTGMFAAVLSVAISPDGTTLATASEDLTIKLWNLNTGKEINTLSWHSGSVRAVTFSPDGQTIASGSNDKTIKQWNVKTGEGILTISGHSDWIRSLAFSPNGQTLASGSDDKTIKQWNVKTGEEIRTLSGHSSYIESLAFSPDGKILASGSCDQTIKLWDAKTGEEIGILEGHTDCVRAVAFSPDGQTLVSGSEDHSMIVWNWQTGQPIRTITRHTEPLGWLNTISLSVPSASSILAGHTDKVTSIAFSPDGQMLASGSDDKTIKLWDLQTGQEIVTLFGHSSYVESVAFSPDSKTLVSGGYDKTVKVWQVPW